MNRAPPAQWLPAWRSTCCNKCNRWAIREQLDPLILNIHGESEHAGKTPRRCPEGSKQRTQLIRLRREMKEAVAAEDYERASKLRDEIRRIEAGE